MFDECSSNNLPILSWEKVLNFLFVLGILLIVPFFEEAHLTIKERSVSLLTAFPVSFSMLFTLR